MGPSLNNIKLYISSPGILGLQGPQRFSHSQFFSFWDPVLYPLTNLGGSALSLTAEYIKVNWIKCRKRMTVN